MNISSEEFAFRRIRELAVQQYFQVPGRVTMLLSHIVSHQSEEAVEYFQLLGNSLYTQQEQDCILRGNPICYKDVTPSRKDNKILVIYTIDDETWKVYRWSKPAPDELEFWAICDMGDFESRVESLMKKWFTFIPPVIPIE